MPYGGAMVTWSSVVASLGEPASTASCDASIVVPSRPASEKSASSVASEKTPVSKLSPASSAGAPYKTPPNPTSSGCASSTGGPPYAASTVGKTSSPHAPVSATEARPNTYSALRPRRRGGGRGGAAARSSAGRGRAQKGQLDSETRTWRAQDAQAMSRTFVIGQRPLDHPRPLEACPRRRSRIRRCRKAHPGPPRSERRAPAYLPSSTRARGGGSRGCCPAC